MSDQKMGKQTKPRGKNEKLVGLDWDVWLERRQVEERHRSLVRRLEGLVQDAQIERLDNAAALLRETAETFRRALRERDGRDAAFSNYQKTGDTPNRTARGRTIQLANSTCGSPACRDEIPRITTSPECGAPCSATIKLLTNPALQSSDDEIQQPGAQSA